jgi:hypothetical protein
VDLEQRISRIPRTRVRVSHDIGDVAAWSRNEISDSDPTFIRQETIMIHRTLTLALGFSASILAAQGALAGQDQAFGYDAFYQFGYERPIAAADSRDTSHLYKSAAPQMPGYEVDYVYGSDARAIASSGSTVTAMQIRDALGEQAGA